MALANKPGLPEEVECPECGRMMDVEEDLHGIVMQCAGMDCLSHYDGRDLFPEWYDDARPGMDQ